MRDYQYTSREGALGVGAASVRILCCFCLVDRERIGSEKKKRVMAHWEGVERGEEGEGPGFPTPST